MKGLNCNLELRKQSVDDYKDKKHQRNVWHFHETVVSLLQTQETL